MKEREERVSEEGPERMKTEGQSGLKFLGPVDVHLDVILSVLEGRGSRSGPAVSN